MAKGKWSCEQKVAIVLEGIKSSNVAELCHQNGASQAQLYRWRETFLEAGKKALSSAYEGNKKKQVQTQISELERIIGRLTIENQILKKTEELMGM